MLEMGGIKCVSAGKRWSDVSLLLGRPVQAQSFSVPTLVPPRLRWGQRLLCPPPGFAWRQVSPASQAFRVVGQPAEVPECSVDVLRGPQTPSAGLSFYRRPPSGSFQIFTLCSGFPSVATTTKVWKKVWLPTSRLHHCPWRRWSSCPRPYQAPPSRAALRRSLTQGLAKQGPEQSFQHQRPPAPWPPPLPERHCRLLKIPK